MARALRTCTMPGCPTLTPGDRCPAHKRQAAKQRGTAHKRGYDAKHRTRFRDPVLLRDPVCTCTAQCPTHGVGGCAAWSTVADHWPHSRAELVLRHLDPYDPRHGRGLCKPCHDRHTAAAQPGGWNNRTGTD